MKKITVLLLVLCLLYAFTGCGSPKTPDDGGSGDAAVPTVQTKLEKILASGKLIVATSPDYPPCEFVDPTKTGQDSYVGADIELAKYIADALGVELVIEAMDFDSIQAAVQMGSVDLGISGFSWTAKRAEAVALSDGYNSNDYGQGLLVMKGQESAYASIESFSGKKVACQNGSLQQTLVNEQLPDDVQIEVVTNIADAVLMLIEGKVDAVAVSGENGLALAANYDSIALCDFKFEIDSEQYVVEMQMGQDDLLAKINEIIATVVEQGLYSEWMSDAMALQESLGVE